MKYKLYAHINTVVTAEVEMTEEEFMNKSSKELVEEYFPDFGELSEGISEEHMKEMKALAVVMDVYGEKKGDK